MTEVGLIPEDWEVKRFNEISEILVAQDLKMESYSSQYSSTFNIPVYSNTVDNRGLYGFYDFEEYRGNSLSIVGRGAGLGTAFFRDMGFGAIGRLLVLYPGVSVDARYLTYFVNGKLHLFQESGGIPQLTRDGLGNYFVTLPPLPEQKAIAEVLSDTDALILSLEKLIAKKRLIKQGTMQQLLTPKEGWEVRKLGEISSICTGKKNNEEKIENGQFPFFVRSQNVERINSYSFDGEAILIPGEGGVGSIYHYIEGKFDYHQRVYKISDFNANYSGKYVFCFMQKNFGQHAMQNTVKATVDSLRLPTFLSFILFFPKTRDEQEKIALILTQLDDEIELLETKLEKYKKIKSGMMQQLLTGKIRLSNKEKSNS